MRRRLSEEDEAEIALRYRRGASERQLAERFDVPRPLIQRVLARQDVRRRPTGFIWRREDVDTATLARLRAQGLTYAEIAKRVGMSRSGVRTRLIEHYARKSLARVSLPAANDTGVGSP